MMNPDLERLDAAIAEKTARLAILDEEALKLEGELAKLKLQRHQLVEKEESK